MSRQHILRYSRLPLRGERQFGSQPKCHPPPHACVCVSTRTRMPRLVVAWSPIQRWPGWVGQHARKKGLQWAILDFLRSCEKQALVGEEETEGRTGSVPNVAGWLAGCWLLVVGALFRFFLLFSYYRPPHATYQLSRDKAAPPSNHTSCRPEARRG